MDSIAQINLSDGNKGESFSANKIQSSDETNTLKNEGQNVMKLTGNQKEINMKKLPRSARKKIRRAEKMALIKSLRKEKKLMKKQQNEARKKNKPESCANIISFSENESDQLEDTAIENETESDQVDDAAIENENERIDDAGIENETESNEINASEHVSKRIRLQQVKERCKEAIKTGQRICIDCSLEEYMSAKECSKLAQQIGRLYGRNRQSIKPAHIYLTGLNITGTLFNECCRKNSGFQNYILTNTSEPIENVFDNNSIVYLTPDADNILETVDVDKVYVIGGLVDETVKSKTTLTKAKQLSITTARLPIERYMCKLDAESGSYSYNQILAVNQVFEILLTFCETGDWAAALSACVPRRKGFAVSSACVPK